jgi:hypothetical protein
MGGVSLPSIELLNTPVCEASFTKAGVEAGEDYMYYLVNNVLKCGNINSIPYDVARPLNKPIDLFLDLDFNTTREEEKMYYLHEGLLFCANILGFLSLIQHRKIYLIPKFSLTPEQKLHIVTRALNLLYQRIDPLRRAAQAAQLTRVTSNEKMLLMGPEVVYRWQASDGSKDIYLYGEEHISSLCPVPNIGLAKFLEQEIRATTEHIDLFLEQAPEWKRYNSSRHMSSNSSQLTRTINTFRSCGMQSGLSQVQCIYPNLRVHHVDLRMDDGTPRDIHSNDRIAASFRQLDGLSGELYELYDVEEWSKNEQLQVRQLLLQVIEICTNFQNFISQSSTEKDYIESLVQTSPRVMRQISKLTTTMPAMAQRIVKFIVRNSPIDLTDHKDELAQTLSRLITSRDTEEYRDGVAATSDLLMMMAISLKPLMDMYTLARLFRTYPPRAHEIEVPDTVHVRRAIIVAGSGHIRMYSDFFAQMFPKFGLAMKQCAKVSPIDYDDETYISQCVPLLPVALFSNPAVYDVNFERIRRARVRSGAIVCDREKNITNEQAEQISSDVKHYYKYDFNGGCN